MTPSSILNQGMQRTPNNYGGLLPPGITRTNHTMKQKMIIEVKYPADALLWVAAFCDSEKNAERDYNIRPGQLNNPHFMDQKEGVLISVYRREYRGLREEGFQFVWQGPVHFPSSSEYYVKSYQDFHDIILAVLKRPEIKIGDYAVEFFTDHIQVGCQKVTHEQVKQIYERII